MFIIFSGENSDKFFDEQSSTEQSKIEMACNITNVFTVTFEQFKASLLNKYIIDYIPNLFFNTNNKKCFLSGKSVYYNYFWGIMWHWKLE